MPRILKDLLRKIVPPQVLSYYHLFLAYLGAMLYGSPSRKLMVIGVTGTKGKTSVTEMINAILEEAGYTTAVLNSIRIKLASDSEDNTMRMSMPGRFYIQKFLAHAVKENCTAAILEMTSEGARQSRHRGIELDALVFTNLAPEHIESHGSYEAYADAKFSLAKALERSRKRPRVMVANADDKEGPRYLALKVEKALPFTLSAHTPYSADERGGSFAFEGQTISLSLPGEFSLANALAAATTARALDIDTATIVRALGKMKDIPGRGERIELGQEFTVVIDYAHTPDSLLALYNAYKNTRKICVLGSMGGGRDTWKRPLMGKIAEEHCDMVILTDEDPCDEGPRQIVEDIAKGMTKRPEVVMDRRRAISSALEIALSLSKNTPRQNARGDQNSVAVLITGKGTNHEICGPGGKNIPWSDKEVAQEELEALLEHV